MKASVQLYLTAFCLFSGLASCSSKSPDQQATDGNKRNDSALAMAQSGDIILRCGRDEISKLFCRLNTRNQNYSHCGVLRLTDTGLYVIHVIGGAENPEGHILYEPVHTFIRAEAQQRWALVRYDFDRTQKKSFEQNIRQALKTDTRFDAAFDLATDDKMYCSELLYKTILKTTGDSSYIKPSLSSSGKRYIAIDDLFDNGHSKTVCEVSYK